MVADRQRFGNSPWSVLSGGIDRHVQIGTGIGIGTVLEVMDRNVGRIDNFVVRYVMMVLGLIVVGIGGALYLSSRYGPGPRDGLMTGIGTLFNRSIAHVRLALELTVLTLGWALGGRVGVGTMLFAAGIGHVLAFFVAQLQRLDQRRNAPTDQRKRRIGTSGHQTFDRGVDV